MEVYMFGALLLSVVCAVAALCLHGNMPPEAVIKRISGADVTFVTLRHEKDWSISACVKDNKLGLIRWRDSRDGNWPEVMNGDHIGIDSVCVFCGEASYADDIARHLLKQVVARHAGREIRIEVLAPLWNGVRNEYHKDVLKFDNARTILASLNFVEADDFGLRELWTRPASAVCPQSVCA